MDFFSWQNMQNVRLATSLKPFKKLTLGLEYRAFWLADTQDYFYNVAGLPRKTGGYGLNASYNPYVGSEVDLVATCALTSYANVQAGLGHFFVGSYIESSLAGLGGASDANYLYLQGILNF